MLRNVAAAAAITAIGVLASPFSARSQEVIPCILVADVQEYPVAGADCSFYHADFYALCEDGTIYYMGQDNWETCSKVV